MVTGDLFAAVSAPSGQFYSKLKLSYFFLLNVYFIVTIRADFHLDEQELLVFEKLKGVSTTERIRTERLGVVFWWIEPTAHYTHEARFQAEAHLIMSLCSSSLRCPCCKITF